jgi:hypothetical protein
MLLGQSSSTSGGIGTLHKFLNGGNNRQLRHVHSLAARLVVHNKLPCSTTTSDDFNELIHAASHLRIGTTIPMTKRKMDYLLVQMYASFIADVCALIASTRALFVYDNATKDVNDVNSSINNLAGPESTHCGWMIVCHDGWDSTLKHFFGVSIFSLTLQHGFGTNWLLGWQLQMVTVLRSVLMQRCWCLIDMALEHRISMRVSMTLPLLRLQPVVPWLEKMATA